MPLAFDQSERSEKPLPFGAFCSQRFYQLEELYVNEDAYNHILSIALCGENQRLCVQKPAPCSTP